MEAKTYSAKSAAVRAARAVLGAEAQPGTDFTVSETPTGWTWAPPSEAVERVRSEEPALAAAPLPVVEKMAGQPSDQARAGAAPKTRISPQYREALARAEKGELPEKPDFSAETHKRWRPKLDEVVALAEAGNIEGLKAYAIKPISTSPKAIDRYRNLAVIALEARA